MNKSGPFWKIIAASRRALIVGQPNGNMARQARALRDALSRLAPTDVVDFQETLIALHHDAYSWDLWGAAHVIAQGCSDDNFFDFRSWLISSGRDAYHDALADPDSLVGPASDPSVEDVFFEGFLEIPASAYIALTGKPIPEASSRHPTSPKGKRWKDEAELAVRYPKLWARFRTNQPT